MRRSTASLALGGLLLAACGRADSRRAAADSAAPTAAAGSAAGAPCLPPGGVRLGAAEVGGLPVRAAIDSLRRRCPGARTDTVGAGGPVVALRLEGPGARLWAVQDRYEDTLRGAEPPDYWYAEGDSLRLADGRPVPRTLGGFRALGEPGAVVADLRDDADGVYVVLCRAPAVRFMFGFDLRPPADTGSWPLSAGVVPDTSGLWRVEVDGAPRRATPRGCGRAPAT